MATATDNAATFQNLASILNSVGLGDLFTFANGKPGGWLWDQVQKGNDSFDQLQLSLEQTQAFKNRYGIISEMRARAAAGENVHVPTIADVREYETKAATMMRQAGLPSWFYDSYQDTQALMRKDIALPELEQRIGQGWSVVRDADPAVRQAFTDFYGVANGDAALAAFVLDPGHSLAQIEKASRAAYTAGYGQTMGLNVDKVIAERVADLPTTTAGIQQSLSEASRLSALTNEGITETNDITDGSLVEATALGDGGKLADVTKRLSERQANDRSNQGGALQTQQGLTGVRSV